MKSLTWRPIAVIVVIATAIIYVLPTIQSGLWPYKKINLGLDLQGGMHLVLQVDTEKAVEDTLERIAQELRTRLRKDRIRAQQLERIQGNQILVKVRGQDHIEKLEKLLDKDFKDLRLVSRRAYCTIG